MQIKSQVFCTLSFEGIHQWSSCPIEEVQYLRDAHRHMFHVKAYVAVNHDDRDVEFIQLKHQIRQFIYTNYPLDPKDPSQLTVVLKNMSCEMIATDLIKQFNLTRCIIDEDGENGADLTVI